MWQQSMLSSTRLMGAFAVSRRLIPTSRCGQRHFSNLVHRRSSSNSTANICPCTRHSTASRLPSRPRAICAGPRHSRCSRGKVFFFHTPCPTTRTCSLARYRSFIFTHAPFLPSTHTFFFFCWFLTFFPTIRRHLLSPTGTRDCTEDKFFHVKHRGGQTRYLFLS